MLQLINNHYLLQDIALLDIAKKYGTPLYLYDGNKIEQQYQKLTQAFANSNVKFKYAMKALNNSSILKILLKQGCGLDTVSIQEVELGLKAGFLPNDIIFTPNCVALEEIEAAAALGVQINIDNISILEQFGMRYGNSIPVCVRINPHIMAGGHFQISTGHIDSKFGISIHQMRHVHRVVKATNLCINGVHMHTGSDIVDADVFLRSAEILFETAMDFPDLLFLNFGSGFKVSYKAEDEATNITLLGEQVTNRFNAFCKEYGRQLELWFEPGKFLVSEAGYFLAQVNVVKTTTATVFAGLNTGFNHLIRPMFYDAHHDIINISYPQGTPRYYTIVGYICETDTFGWDRKINEINEGDILLFKNAGAYGFTMSSNYNARLRPAEVLVYNKKLHLIRRAELLDDLQRTEIEADLWQ